MPPTGPIAGGAEGGTRLHLGGSAASEPASRTGGPPIRVAVVTGDRSLVEWVRRAFAEGGRRYGVIGPLAGPSLAGQRADVFVVEIGYSARRDAGRYLRSLRLPASTPLLLIASKDFELGGLDAAHPGVADVLRRPSITEAGLRRSVANALERLRLAKTLARAVRRARASEANFRDLLFRSAEGLLLVDRAGVVRLVNPAAEAILGLGAARLVGERLALPPADGVVRDVLLPRRGRRPVPVKVRAVELRDESEDRILVSIQDQRGRQRGERIAAAREVHRGLLPGSLRARYGPLDAAAWNEYCQDASGDYYDVLSLKDDLLGIAVGDVSGHGLDAAVLMAEGRAFLRAYWKAEAGLPKVLHDLNESMARDMPSGRFMTLFLAQVELRTGVVRWGNAGHPSALLLRASTSALERLRSKAPPIGIDAETEFPAGPLLRLAPGDVLLACTDGVTEARSPGGALLGEERLGAYLRKFAGRRPARIIDGIRSALAEWTGTRALQDDITVVALKWDPAGEAGAARPRSASAAPRR